LLSAGIDETLRLWDTRTRRELGELRGHDGPVFGVAFSPDGQKALSAGRDGLVILWSLETGTSISWIEAHDGPVWAVAFSRDGRFALSAGSDKTMRMWHLDTGSRIGAPAADDGGTEPWLESTHPGARLFRACAACHALDPQRQSRSGPHLAGLFGRRAGSVPGYAYSAALSGADFTWDHDTITALFRDGPDVVVPGSKMPLQRIDDGQALDALVAYLRIITASGEVPGGNGAQPPR
jgi:cytochrome c